MFSIATAPAKQSVGETISVLSGRLSSASLLEDRRAAILGLRSFAKDYPASVASGALRSLIGSLSKDGEDVDTVKVVLETLLMLFSPNESSPEASEEVLLWLADEFTQRQENITLLLGFLETTDFYSRLYSLQLLSAILAARTERTEECVFTAPLGVSRLVAVLDERREAIRNEAVALLVSLTPTSADIQKLVAFESAFDRIFVIIHAEGGLVDGGRGVEDCLILLANLLRLNASNQSLFRETGCLKQIAQLLDGATQVGPEAEELAAWAQTQRGRNIYALLAVLRLFLVGGAVGTTQNQLAFWQNGLLQRSLLLAFDPSPAAQVIIRAEALVVCADMIRGSANLQESFAQLQVPSPTGQGARQAEAKTNGAHKVFVIDALLDLILVVPSNELFDLRMAACECLKAYLFHHDDIRLHFLRRAIEGHRSGADETANVLTTLLRSPSEQLAVPAADPYRYWFAAVIMLHLLFDNPPAKALAMSVTEGDEANGEEVVTSIQTITAHLLSCLAKGEDDRVSVGYLMLLIGWLYEDLDGVNDFLAEGSNVQGLILAALQTGTGHAVVQGLCVMLLGVAYEFSTKDSAIPRASLQPILTTRLGRDKYVDRLGRLRGHPLMRDFEVLPQKLDASRGQRLPDVYFDATFVDFVRDNYSRLLRAIDRDPGLEIPVVTNGVQKGISRELVDSLKAQLNEQGHALERAQTSVASLERQLGQEQADHRRTKESSSIELANARNATDALQKRQQAELNGIRAEQGRKEQELRRQLEQARKAGDLEAERLQRRAEADMADLKATISRLEVDIMKGNKRRSQDLHAAHKEADTRVDEQLALLRLAEEREQQLVSQAREGEVRSKELERQLHVAENQIKEAQQTLKAKEDEKAAVQGELDDLLMVFGDTEEKLAKYRARLKALGESVSDGEDDDDDTQEEESEREEPTSPDDVD